MLMVDTIRCICGFDDDDGATIACDRCGVWQHMVCVNVQADSIPEIYLCDLCNPRSLDVNAAIEHQRQRKNKEREKDEIVRTKEAQRNKRRQRRQKAAVKLQQLKGSNNDFSLDSINALENSPNDSTDISLKCGLSNKKKNQNDDSEDSFNHRQNNINSDSLSPNQPLKKNLLLNSDVDHIQSQKDAEDLPPVLSLVPFMDFVSKKLDDPNDKKLLPHKSPAFEAQYSLYSKLWVHTSATRIADTQTAELILKLHDQWSAESSDFSGNHFPSLISLSPENVPKIFSNVSVEPIKSNSPLTLQLLGLFAISNIPSNSIIAIIKGTLHPGSVLPKLLLSLDENFKHVNDSEHDNASSTHPQHSPSSDVPIHNPPPKTLPPFVFLHPSPHTSSLDDCLVLDSREYGERGGRFVRYSCSNDVCSANAALVTIIINDNNNPLNADANSSQGIILGIVTTSPISISEEIIVAPPYCPAFSTLPSPLTFFPCSCPDSHPCPSKSSLYSQFVPTNSQDPPNLNTENISPASDNDHSLDNDVFDDNCSLASTSTPPPAHSLIIENLSQGGNALDTSQPPEKLTLCKSPDRAPDTDLPSDTENLSLVNNAPTEQHQPDTCDDKKGKSEDDIIDDSKGLPSNDAPISQGEVPSPPSNCDVVSRIAIKGGRKTWIIQLFNELVHKLPKLSVSINEVFIESTPEILSAPPSDTYPSRVIKTEDDSDIINDSSSTLLKPSKKRRTYKESSIEIPHPKKNSFPIKDSQSTIPNKKKIEGTSTAITSFAQTSTETASHIYTDIQTTEIAPPQDMPSFTAIDDQIESYPHASDAVSIPRKVVSLKDLKTKRGTISQQSFPSNAQAMDAFAHTSEVSLKDNEDQQKRNDLDRYDDADMDTNDNTALIESITSDFVTPRSHGNLNKQSTHHSQNKELYHDPNRSSHPDSLLKSKKETLFGSLFFMKNSNPPASSKNNNNHIKKKSHHNDYKDSNRNIAYKDYKESSNAFGTSISSKNKKPRSHKHYSPKVHNHKSDEEASSGGISNQWQQIRGSNQSPSIEHINSNRNTSYNQPHHHSSSMHRNFNGNYSRGACPSGTPDGSNNMKRKYSPPEPGELMQGSSLSMKQESGKKPSRMRMRSRSKKNSSNNSTYRCKDQRAPLSNSTPPLGIMGNILNNNSPDNMSSHQNMDTHNQHHPSDSQNSRSKYKEYHKMHPRHYPNEANRSPPEISGNIYDEKFNVRPTKSDGNLSPPKSLNGNKISSGAKMSRDFSSNNEPKQINPHNEYDTNISEYKWNDTTYMDTFPQESTEKSHSEVNHPSLSALPWNSPDSPYWDNINYSRPYSPRASRPDVRDPSAMQDVAPASEHNRNGKAYHHSHKMKYEIDGCDSKFDDEKRYNKMNHMHYQDTDIDSFTFYGDDTMHCMKNNINNASQKQYKEYFNNSSAADHSHYQSKRSDNSGYEDVRSVDEYRSGKEWKQLDDDMRSNDELRQSKEYFKSRNEWKFEDEWKVKKDWKSVDVRNVINEGRNKDRDKDGDIRYRDIPNRK